MAIRQGIRIVGLAILNALPVTGSWSDTARWKPRSVQVQNLVEFRDKLALVGAGTATGREELLAEIRIDTGCGARMGGTG